MDRIVSPGLRDSVAAQAAGEPRNNGRSLAVWLLLVFLTLLTYAVGKAQWQGVPIAGLLLASVFIKGHFIIADFMGLRSVARRWRYLVHGWLLLVTSMIGLAYVLALRAG